jgi:hypothetical protein
MTLGCCVASSTQSTQVGHETLSDPRHEAFACYVAQGKSKREAAILAGFAQKYASSFGTQLSKRIKIAQRIAYLQGQVGDRIAGLKRQAAEKAVEAAIKIFEWDIQSKQKRVQMYADMHERLWRIVKERAADPAMAKVPGGQSGFLLKQVKVVGTGLTPKVISEYVPDTALSKEIRALAQQAAEELGQWRDDSKPATSNHVEYYWADPPAVDVEPVKQTKTTKSPIHESGCEGSRRSREWSTL